MTSVAPAGFNADHGGISRPPSMSAVRHVTVEKFHQLTGYSEDAVRSKIKRGDWLAGVIWCKAPDGRILIDLEGYEWWVVNGNQASAQHLTLQSK